MEQRHHGLSTFSRGVLVTGFYVIGGFVGKNAAFISGKVALVWPTAGIALAVILLFGYRFWPAIAAGAFVFSIINGIAISWLTLATALGNSVGAVICAYLLERFVQFRTNLERVRDVAGFILLASLLGTTVNAMFNAVGLAYDGKVAWDELFPATIGWWVPNALGVLVVTPLILAWVSRSSISWTLPLTFEALLCAIGLGLAILASFNSVMVHGLQSYPLAYLPYPFIAWSALRFGQRGSATATLMLGSAAIFTLLHERGPFLTDSEINSVILVGTYISILSVTNLLLAAVACERRAVEAELRRSQSDLAVARDAALLSARLKAEFLANMSHEIRTPLNGIIGMTNLLLKTPLNPQQKDFAQTIRHSGDLLLSIVNDILDFSKLEAGKLSLESIEFDLPQVIENAARLFSSQAKAKGVELTCEIDRSVPQFVNGDATRVWQVLSNLISNALKFTEKGTVSVRAIHLPASTSGSTVRFEVQDSGIGISESVQATLFQAFTQADGSTTRRFGGTGLGLAICRQLVTLMAGSITLKSKPGEGSTFYVEIPFTEAKGGAKREGMTSFFRRVAEAGMTQPDSGAPENPVPSNTQSPLSILLVEDNRVNQQVTVGQLQFLGCKADVVSDGEEAIKAFENRHYDLILLDCQMPRLDGYQTVRRIRQLESDLQRPARSHIVALSASVLPEDRRACLEAGMDDHLGKPLSEDRLRNVLQRWMRLPSATPPALSEPRGAEAGFDLTELAKVTGGDGETIKTLLQLYVSEASEMIRRLENAVQSGDTSAIRFAAHRWAGASTTCGIQPLTGFLRTIEQHARQNDLSEIPALYEKVRQEHKRTIGPIKQQCGL